MYLVFMLGIGLYTNKNSIKNSNDYLVAGRRLPWWLLVGTLAATEIGAGSTMGVTQKAYGQWGLGSAWYIWTMAISFAVIAFIAPILRRSEVRTVPEFFLQKYGRTNHIVTSLIMFFPLIGLTSVQMIATATIFSAVTGIDYTTSAIISCGVIVIYTVLGGMWSVSLTDFYQWILIVFGMGITLPFVIIKSGGWSEMISCIPPAKLNIFEGIGIGTIISLIIMYVSSMLVGQEVTQRLYSGKNEKHVFIGSIVTAGFYVLFAFIPPLLGLSIYALVEKGIIHAEMIHNFSDMYALPILAVNTLPPLIVGFLFAGLVSATMSSASSNLLGAASIFTNDIWVEYFDKKAEDDKKVLIIRWLVGFVGAISLIIAILNPQDIIKILMFSFSLRAAGGFFPYILRHYFNWITPIASLSSLILGSVTVLMLEFMQIKILFLEPIVPALLVSFLTVVITSFITRKPESKLVT
ncbi:MAG: sodium:solute symporter family protein [Cyanobacteriota bacterium]